MRSACVAALLVLAAGCFDPDYPAGQPCGELGACPPGQDCGEDGICWPEGSGGDGGAPGRDGGADAGPGVDARVGGSEIEVEAIAPGSDFGPPSIASNPTDVPTTVGVVYTEQDDVSFPLRFHRLEAADLANDISEEDSSLRVDDHRRVGVSRADGKAYALLFPDANNNQMLSVALIPEQGDPSVDPVADSMDTDLSDTALGVIAAGPSRTLTTAWRNRSPSDDRDLVINVESESACPALLESNEATGLSVARGDGQNWVAWESGPGGIELLPFDDGCVGETSDSLPGAAPDLAAVESAGVAAFVWLDDNEIKLEIAGELGVIGTPEVLASGSGPARPEDPRVAWSPELDELGVAWRDAVGVKFLRVSADGETVLEGPLDVYEGAVDAGPEVVWAGAQYVAVWRESSGITAARIAPPE